MPSLIEHRGIEAFADVHREMLEIAAAVRSGTSQGRVLVLEHEPVFTAGRATQPTELNPSVVPIERGGRITYHGPGQLVVYPIVRLPRRDVRQWLGALEAFGIAICARFDLAALPSVDGTGVFVGGRKVASIGVAIRHWINLHGIALNVAMDLEPFRQIRPCGLDPDVMSNLSTCAGHPIELHAVRDAIDLCIPRLLEG